MAPSRLARLTNALYRRIAELKNADASRRLDAPVEFFPPVSFTDAAHPCPAAREPGRFAIAALPAAAPDPAPAVPRSSTARAWETLLHSARLGDGAAETRQPAPQPKARRREDPFVKRLERL